jgi:hypothetical protein
LKNDQNIAFLFAAARGPRDSSRWLIDWTSQTEKFGHGISERLFSASFESVGNDGKAFEIKLSEDFKYGSKGSQSYCNSTKVSDKKFVADQLNDYEIT